MAVVNNYPFFKLNYSQLDDYQLYVDLAVDIFKSHNQALIIHLKNFLVYLTSPLDIESIFRSAIEQLAITDEQSCRWVLRNPDYLLPEIDLIEVSQQMTTMVLNNQGFVLGRDFQFQSNGKLSACHYAIKKLTLNHHPELEENQNKLFDLIKEEILLLVD